MKTRKLSIRRSTLRLLSGAQNANVRGGTGTFLNSCPCNTVPTDCDPLGCIISLEGTCARQNTCKCEHTPVTEADCPSGQQPCESQPC